MNNKEATEPPADVAYPTKAYREEGELEEEKKDMTLDEKSNGVRQMEGIESVFTTPDRWVYHCTIFLAAFARTLSGLMDPAFQGAAISEWGSAGQASTLGVVRATIGAASQPIWAKVMDNLGRPFTVQISTVFYIVGYIVMATSNRLGTLAGGLVLEIFGFGAQNIFLTVMIADVTSLKWRALFSIIPSLPAIICFWASGVIAAKFIKYSTWRWGYGANTIIYPVLSIPFVLFLFWTQRKAKRNGKLKGTEEWYHMIMKRNFWWNFFWQADVPGIILLAGVIALCLIPLTLGSGTAAKWRTPTVLAPFLCGFCVALPAFVVWEVKYARHPMLPRVHMKDRHIILTCLINVVFVITGQAQTTYLYFTLLVPFGKGVETATRISRLTFFLGAVAGILFGFLIRFFPRPKAWTVFSSCLYLLAYGVLYRYRGGHSQSEFIGLVAGETLLGIAMIFGRMATQTGVQAVVKHEHLAIISAMVATSNQIGAGVGSAISGAIWTNMMPKELFNRIQETGMSAPEAKKLAMSVFGNPIAFIAKYPPGTPLRDAVDLAYRRLNRLLCITGLACSVGCIFISLFLRETPLTNKRTLADDDSWAIASNNSTETEVEREVRVRK